MPLTTPLLARSACIQQAAIRAVISRPPSPELQSLVLGTTPDVQPYTSCASVLTGALRLRGGNDAASAGSTLWDPAVFFVEAVRLVNYGGGLLMLFGVVLALINMSLFFCNKCAGTTFTTLFAFEGKTGKPVQIARVRLQLGSLIMLSLTILVASDVIDTLIKPTHEYTIEALYKLAIVATIRTGLSYFLARELKEVEEELEQCDATEITV
uniref:Uncharacterized protein n=1 Tax=Chrysotila carterae TaxID=13221 RepID=A0A7S4AZN4_CHRCT